MNYSRKPINTAEKIVYLIGLVFLVAMAFSFVVPANAQSYYDSYYDDYYGGYGDYYDSYYDDYYGGYGDYYDDCYDCYDDYYGGYYDYYDDYYDDCYDCYAYDYDDYYYDDCYDCYYDDYYYPDYSYCYDCYTPPQSNDIYINNTNTNTNTNTNNNVVYQYPDNNYDDYLTVSCYALDYNVETGESVTWVATADGGTGSYSYEWFGSSPLNGRTGRSVTVSYGSEGSKHASVTVKSGNKTRTADCGTIYVDNYDHDDDHDDDEDWTVSCKASPSRVEEGETVRWIASTDGVSESKVDFEWSRDADGDDEEVTERYNKSGTYEAKVTARYKGHTETDTCTVRVEDEDNDHDDDTKVVVTKTTPYVPPYVPPSLSSVYLSQVPYTGAAETAKLVGFITMLTLASLAGAYYVVTKKARADRKSFLERFKQDNLAKKA